MLSFLFKKSQKASIDLSFIGVDMHSHLLPGLDDGLQNIEQTVSFVRRLKEKGYKKLICTPHILSDLYPNNPDTILPKLEQVRKALEENEVDIKIEAGAEYMVDIEMETYLKNKKPMLPLGNKLLLIEMSYLVESPNMEQVIFELRMQGYQPVLAHPERYSYYHRQFEKYERYVDMGCLLQVNLLSLLGYYSKPVRLIAEKLLKNKMVSLLGTDMHHEKHLAALEELASQKEFYKLLENANIKNNELLG